MGYSCGYHLYPLVGSISCRPPRVRAITFISQPPHLLYGVRVALDFFLSCRVVRPKSALYEVSVRRPETLPVLALLSLHIRLPSDPTSRWAPLPSASGSCYRARSGLSPPSYRPCRAHNCLLNPSDAADAEDSVDHGGHSIPKKTKTHTPAT